MNYKAMYFHLFNAAASAIDAINHGDPLAARELLMEAQRFTEELYLDACLDAEDEDAGLTPEERYELVFHERIDL